MKNKDQQYSISKRLWSKEQDQLLVKIVGDQISPKWTYISQEFNEAIKISTASTHISRTNKQCRQRWQNHLNPTLKNHLPWSEDQHRALFKLFKEYSHQWCELAAKLQAQGFERRGENNIKNYFYSAIKRQIKRINQVIRQSNKQTKRKKSQINQYRKIYGYNPRLSLQRQILGLSSQSKQFIPQARPLNDEQSIPEPIKQQSLPQPYLEYLKQPSKNQANLPLIQQSNLHIIKQLDYELISKILLIAQEKGGKKFVISSNLSKQCHQEAEQLRNQLIQLITQRQKPIENQYVRDLAVKMLKMSRKCKRKTQKMGNQKEETHQIDEFQSLSKKKAKNTQQAPVVINNSKQENCNPNAFDEKAEIDKFFRIDEKPSIKCFGLDLLRNSHEYKADQGYPHLSILSSFDSGRHLIDSRNIMDKSSQFLCNSNYSMLNYFESHNPINHHFNISGEINSAKEPKSPQNIFFSQFINSIREVQPKEEQIAKPTQFTSPPSGLFPVFDLAPFQAQKKSIFSSQPINNAYSPQLSAFKSIKTSSNQSTQNALNRSWAYSYDQADHSSFKSLFQNRKDEQTFSIPNHGFSNFGQK